MSFLLFTGWLLGGFETGPADQTAINRAFVFLGLGFAFILGYLSVLLLDSDVNRT